MRTKNLHLCCLLAVLLTPTVCAQQAPVFQSTIPSPNDIGVVKNIQSNMNYYDGTMQIEVPLYTLSEFGLSVPIYLKYKTSGIKVEDEASSVGLGWNLSAGGKITRIVKRNADESENGFYNEPVLSISDMYKLLKSNSPTFADTKIDFEPDVFYFEIPNYSGMFVCDREQNVHTIPYQNIRINWVGQSHFEIMDPEGNLYILGKSAASQEKSTFNNGDKSISYTSAWLLDTIEDQYGNRISFTYQTGQAVSIIKKRTTYTFNIDHFYNGPNVETITNPTKKDYQEHVKNVTMTVETPKYLKGISGQSTWITFDCSIRNDLINSLKYNRINISTFEIPKKTISFEYSTFQNNTLKLDAIYESCGTLREKLAEFRYYTTPELPQKTSLAFDHWGYYNGKNNTTLFPRFNDGFCEFTTNTANRDPDIYYAKANTLTSIRYKTGEYTNFEYELNKVKENGATIDIGGLRVKSITRSDNSGKREKTSLSYTTSISGGESTGLRAGRKPNYSYFVSQQIFVNGQSVVSSSYTVFSHRNDDVFNIRGNTAEYYRVGEKFPNGSYNIYEYSTSKDIGAEDKYVGEKPYDIFLDYTIWGGPAPVVTSRYWRRGLLRKIQHYDAANNLISSVVNEYSFGDPKATVRAASPQFSNIGVIQYAYDWISEPVFLSKTTTEAGLYNTASTMTYTYDSTYLVPTEIKEENEAGDTNIKRITYPFNYPNFYPVTANVEALVQLQRQKIIVPVETLMIKNDKVVNGEYFSYKLIDVFTTGLTGNNNKAVVPAAKWSLALSRSLATSDFSPAKFAKTINISSGKTSWTQRLDSRYKQEMIFDHYNSNGQLLSSHEPNGNIKSTIYGYGGKLPIAEIDNARVTEYGIDNRDNQVFYTSFEDASTSYSIIPKTGNIAYYGRYIINLEHFAPGTYSLTYWESRDFGKTWEKVSKLVPVNSTSSSYSIGNGSTCLDEVRMLPLNARMTTYTYRMDAGKTSVTDINDITAYYEYDDFGRLIRISDDQHNPIKSFEHHFKH